MELLVVISIIALLISILLPNLKRARAQAKAVVCASNIRQLHLANTSYAVENNDLYVPAASDIQVGFGGTQRWHGVRESSGVDPDPEKNTFDPRLGPLAVSLLDGAVKACPQRVAFETDGAQNAFEAGCGGYGYNLYGIGSRIYATDLNQTELASRTYYALGWWTSRVRKPAGTVMFTDAAFHQFHSQYGDYLTEYSFCEPPWNVSATLQGPIEQRGEPAIWWLSSPSVHFRHSETTNIAWCDGHVSSERLKNTKSGNERWQLGWFGELTNDSFSP